MEAIPMPDSLQELEVRRAALLKQFTQLGDLRSGSISNTSGRCGKANCHCHQPGQPVHGPNPRLTYKVQGKTVTESLRHPPLRKKRNARSPNSAVSSNSSESSWMLMPRSAALDPWNNHQCPRKKNDDGGL